MIPIIRAIMENLVGVEVNCYVRSQLIALMRSISSQDASKIDIIANDVEHLPNGSWTIKYRHPERCVTYAGGGSNLKTLRLLSHLQRLWSRQVEEHWPIPRLGAQANPFLLRRWRLGFERRSAHCVSVDLQKPANSSNCSPRLGPLVRQGRARTHERSQGSLRPRRDPVPSIRAIPSSQGQSCRCRRGTRHHSATALDACQLKLTFANSRRCRRN